MQSWLQTFERNTQYASTSTQISWMFFANCDSAHIRNETLRSISNSLNHAEELYSLFLLMDTSQM